VKSCQEGELPHIYQDIGLVEHTETTTHVKFPSMTPLLSLLLVQSVPTLTSQPLPWIPTPN